jgi:hypothetical protein
MKKEIDLRKFDGKAESANICRYLGRDYEPISTWEQLIPMMQEIGDDFIGLDGGDAFCDADLMYEHDMNSVLYKDVHYVRNKVSKLVDYINKHKRKVVKGHLYKLTVENLYEHKMLRNAFDNEQIHHLCTDSYVWIDKDEQQVWSFIYEEKSHMFIADFCNNYFEAENYIDLIEKMYSEAGWNVEPNIVFEA